MKCKHVREIQTGTQINYKWVYELQMQTGVYLAYHVSPILYAYVNLSCDHAHEQFESTSTSVVVVLCETFENRTCSRWDYFSGQE